MADKLAFVLTPVWLYLPMAKATGQLAEYMLRAKERQAGSEHFTALESVQLNCTGFAGTGASGHKELHCDGGSKSIRAAGQTIGR